MRPQSAATPAVRAEAVAKYGFPTTMSGMREYQAQQHRQSMAHAKFAFDRVDVGEAARAATEKRRAAEKSKERLRFEASLSRTPGSGRSRRAGSAGPTRRHPATVNGL